MVVNKPEPEIGEIRVYQVRDVVCTQWRCENYQFSGCGHTIEAAYYDWLWWMRLNYGIRNMMLKGHV